MRVALLAACLLQLWLSVHGEGKYTVIGPGTIHAGHKYNVAVGVYETKAPSQIKVGITGPSYNETKTVELPVGNELKNVEFNVPELVEGTYNLTAEGLEGLIFKNSTALNMKQFPPYVRIQTDKGTYKPGDVVNFRILFLDENLKPGKPHKDAVVWFEDGKRNRLKEIKQLSAVKGVYTGKFQISEFPVLGGWRLIAQNGNSGRSSTVAYFQVDKYVLPKYNVKVEATKQVSVKDGDVNIVVRSNYTYGKPVNAKVTALLVLDTWYYRQDEEKDLGTPPVLIRTADMVNGKSKIDLNVKEWAVFLPNERSSYNVKVTATVEEQFTGVKINGTSHIDLYGYRYSMRCPNYEDCNSFSADKEKDVVIQIVYIDNTPLKDTKSVVRLIFTQTLEKNNYWNAETTTEGAPPEIEKRKLVLESKLNETSFAAFKVSLPDLPEFKGYFHYYDVEVEYLDEKQSIGRAYQNREQPTEPTPKVEEPKDWFTVQANYKENEYSYKLGEMANFTVNSSLPLTYLIYNIIARGNLLSTQRLDLTGKPKIYELTFPTTYIMAPRAHIYVYYIDEQGELHYDESTLRTQAELQNEIEITAAEQVKPGSNVDLHIKTPTSSFVGLLAVDQSVLLLGRSNDFSRESFQYLLGGINTRTPWQGGYSRYPGDTSGVVTLTNADYFYNYTKPEFGGVGWGNTEMHKLGLAPHISSFAGASGAIGGGFGGGTADIRVRTDFSEVWLFDDINNTATEEFTWSKTIPDTITSWVVTGFSLNEEKGIGVTKEQTKITTFQPFFIAVRLPYSVKRGEVINVPALIFNYLAKDLDVELTLDNSDNEYDFVEVSNEVINEKKRVKSIRVPASEARGLSFMIRPKTVGNLMLKFTAVSPIAGDAIHKTLKVVPEGITQYANRAYFVNLKDSPSFKETFTLELPEEVVPNSEHIEFGVVGNLLGPLVMNLDRLVRLPMGCGEQTMSAMLPNYLVMQYLQSINRLTPSLEYKIKRNLEAGYQNMLQYRHEDGSFSSFGPAKRDEKPRNGSTWLTAYVVRSLHQMGKVIEVDDKILEAGIVYLSKQQAENGTFLERGDYFYSSQRQHLTLTASVLLAYLENKEHTRSPEPTVEKALKYLSDNFGQTEDLHAKVLATYALHQAAYAEAPTFIQQVRGLAKTEDDRMWWSPNTARSHCWWCWSYSNEVEVTSYALLTILDLDAVTIDEVLPIIKWLVAQRNSYGGFSSTQDTVVGLQALIKFAKKSGFQPAVMDIDLSAEGPNAKKDTIKVNEDNGLLLQISELPEKTHSVQFEAKGTGASLVQISYQYNILEKDPQPSFTIYPNINRETPAFKLEMDVCVNYTGEGEASNMAVLEVSLPSGYVADSDSFKHINKVGRVRLTETKNSESVIVVYFESLHKDETQCLPIEAVKSFAVAMQKPASIVLYDYYDTSKRASNFYEITSKICEICEGDEECLNACS